MHNNLNKLLININTNINTNINKNKNVGDFMCKYSEYDEYRFEEYYSSELSYEMEDFLREIKRLSRGAGYTKTGILSRKMQLKTAISTKMLAKLKKLGYIQQNENIRKDKIVLTKKGDILATYFIIRRKTIYDFLESVGSENILTETELIEHELSPKTVKGIKILLTNMTKNVTKND